MGLTLLDFEGLLDWFPAMPESWRLRCRVCGREQEEPPWGNDGWSVPSFDVCLCCGTEFGVADESPVQVAALRELWLRKGACWFSPKESPSSWDLSAQLALIPPPFQRVARISSMGEFHRLLKEYDPILCACAVYASEQLLDSVLNTTSCGPILLSYSPYLDTKTFKKILSTGNERARTVLSIRPEVAWRDDWCRLVGG